MLRHIEQLFVTHLPHLTAGESAARTIKAALSQFEACFDTSAPATIVVSRFLEDEQKAFQLVEQAAKQDALLVYTLVRVYFFDCAEHTHTGMCALVTSWVISKRPGSS